MNASNLLIIFIVMFWEIIEGIHSQTKQKALGDSL